MKALTVPASTGQPEVLADWMELNALISADGTCSIADLSRALDRGASDDDDLPDEEGDGRDSDGPRPTRDMRGELNLTAAESAFDELERRSVACGPTGYAFEVLKDGHAISLKQQWNETIYAFLLLIGYYVRSAKNGEKLFEEICAEASASYFGGRAAGTEAYAFGFPRRHPNPKHFPTALDDLCRRLGEGEGAVNSPNVGNQKDGTLDVVVWRHFADRREGKLIGFGQCATGHTNWRTKLSELQPRAFIDKWVRRPITVLPVRLYFVPWCFDNRSWTERVKDAGIVFDRCRISEFSCDLPTDLKVQCLTWTNQVFAKHQGSRIGTASTRSVPASRRSPKRSAKKGSRASRTKATRS